MVTATQQQGRTVGDTEVSFGCARSLQSHPPGLRFSNDLYCRSKAAKIWPCSIIVIFAGWGGALVKVEVPNHGPVHCHGPFLAFLG